MDGLMGAGIFLAGAAVGAWMQNSHFRGLLNIQRKERKASNKEIALERRYSDEMARRLENSEAARALMEMDRAHEMGWCDGYEAGMRDALNGQTIGDVIALARLRRARRIN